MKWFKRFRKEESGSATIEFLGIVPVALILLMVILQFIVGINGVLVTQSAANEYASVYSITKNQSEASAAANKILNSTGNYLSSQSISVNGSKNFTAQVNSKIKLIFLPEKIRGYSIPQISLQATASGRVIE
ncbi:pilus assembly protein [Virgibacillus sp. C22-A2]|uniref:Pilus assembly protein n=1 Tax=Virgibacillus tibetensis TaxID=3042313 RepID=A0ABU6KHZ0_9BACI|nr:pilus assembly protein [Virgibacillus sp. C22-A2]